MPRHIFLTGEKQTGKSTLLRRILADCPGPAGGFFTVRTQDYLPGRSTVHLLPAGRDAAAGAENLLFVCGGSGAAVSRRFDRLGCAALEESRACALLVMDELGPHERGAAAFRRAVLSAVEGTIPILGVLQAPAAACWPEIAGHPAVELIVLTPENRDDAALRRHILSTLRRP